MKKFEEAVRTLRKSTGNIEISKNDIRDFLVSFAQFQDRGGWLWSCVDEALCKAYAPVSEELEEAMWDQMMQEELEWWAGYNRLSIKPLDIY